jgi:hypothetical protein
LKACAFNEPLAALRNVRYCAAFAVRQRRLHNNLIIAPGA